MLKIDDTVLLIIDVQGNLAQKMHEKETLFHKLNLLINSANIFDIPVLLTEQAPEKIGETIPEVKNQLTKDTPVIPKTTFSCCLNDQFNATLEKLNRKQILICGIEAHVCIYQTAIDLLEQDYQVSMLCDAISARHLVNKELAIKRLAQAGVLYSNTEMAVFELLRSSQYPKFKEILTLFKQPEE